MEDRNMMQQRSRPVHFRGIARHRGTTPGNNFHGIACHNSHRGTTPGNNFRGITRHNRGWHRRSRHRGKPRHSGSRTPQEGQEPQNFSWLADPSSYEKDPTSATTLGQEYEVALCCFLFLRALRLTRDFSLASNLKHVDKFDDVGLFYWLEGDDEDEYRTILLQAKHREKITLEDLRSTKLFQLKDYFESFKKLRETGNKKFDNTTLVVYTNAKFDLDEHVLDVTDIEELDILKNFLNTGGRLLRLSDAGARAVFHGGSETATLPPETKDFVSRLVLCTEQVNVDTSDHFVGEELRNFFKLPKEDTFANDLNLEFTKLVKAWCSKRGKVPFLTAKSDEWQTIVSTQVERLNKGTSSVDRTLNLGFSKEYGDSPSQMSWISVTDECQGKIVRVRLFREKKGKSLIIDGKSVDTRSRQFKAVWRGDICPTLVVDLSAEEGSPVMQRLRRRERLQRLLKGVQNDADRRLVVVARGKPPNNEWYPVVPRPTWSDLCQATRDRLLDTRVRLQGAAVMPQLRNVLLSCGDDFMTDKVISALCKWKTEVRLGAEMPEPLKYYVPRCLVRSSSSNISLQSLESRSVLIFLVYRFSPVNVSSERLKILSVNELDNSTAIECPTIVKGINDDYNIRQLCCRFRVSGLLGQLLHRQRKALQSLIKEFVPFTWTCKDKVMIVEGLPGVGKSTFVTMMCRSVKEEFPEAWVLRVDLGGRTDYIKEREFTEVSDIKELLLLDLSKSPNDVEWRLLEHSLTVTGNVFLFLDAFDEISPHYTSKCCVLLQSIARGMKFRQMVVTTRPVTTRDVEEALQTRAFTLPVFCEEEQRLFIKQFSEARGKEVNEEEISSLRRTAGPVLEIPLICRMATELLLHSKHLRLEKCLQPWKRVLLYELFVEQTITQHVAEKNGISVSRPGAKELIDESKKTHLKNLQGLAVQKLIPGHQLPLHSVSTETPKEKLGLVVNTGFVDFEHRTLAEYFLGCWLACHWQLCPRELLREFFHRDGFQFVVATFNWSLFCDSPLHVAVAQGDGNAVRKPLPAGTRDRGGRSALHVAAMTQGGHREVWELLVASGEDLDMKDVVMGVSVARYAEILENWEFVDFALEKQANIADLEFIKVEAAARRVHTYAIQKDLVSLCQFIWKQHLNISKNGSTLHMAAYSNSIQVLKLLIDNGSEIDGICEYQGMELHNTSKGCQVQGVRLANVSDHDFPIYIMDGSTELMSAAYGGHLEVVKLLLDKGADINIKTEGGWTVLMWAARGGHLDAVKFLLDNGADSNTKTKEDETALMCAAYGGHLEVVKLLLDKGADINIKTEGGWTVLMWAVRRGHLQVAKLLLDNGADINMKNRLGMTALMTEAERGHLEAVKFLLDNGAEINMKNKLDMTALMWAADQGHVEVIKLLLDNCADINMKNVHGCTALMLTVYNGDLELVKLLLDNKADLNTKNENGCTALDYATCNGQVELDA